MQILIVGGDMRHTHLAALARARGHDVQLLGHHETTLSDARPASEIVMPFPRSEEDGLAPAPFSREALPIAAVAELILPGARVLAARPGPLLQKCLQDRRCVHKDPNDVESFQLRNAVPSAEGALYALLGRSGACLCGKTCLLTGYGRIARALALRLRALGVEVTVAARSAADRARAAGDGLRAVPLAGMAGPYAMLVNTVPAPVVGEAELSALLPGAMALDLAGAPYGIDLQAAGALGVDAWREPGAAGRFAPRTAAEAMLELLEEEGA